MWTMIHRTISHSSNHQVSNHPGFIIVAPLLLHVRRFLSVNFGFRPLFLFADDALSCFVYAVITVNTVAYKTLSSSAVFVTDAPANRAPTICLLSKSERSRISPIACYNRCRTKCIIHWNITYKTCHVNCALHMHRIIYTEAVLATCNKLYYIHDVHIILSSPCIYLFFDKDISLKQ